MLSIDSLMKKPLVTAAPGDTVTDAAKKMQEARVGAILVVEDERIAGIFTERDLLRVVAEGIDVGKTPVGEVATRQVVTLTSGERLRTCAKTLRDGGFRHMPVVDGDRPIGILSARDFLVAATEGLEQFIERARFDSQLRDEIDPYDHLGGSYGR